MILKQIINGIAVSNHLYRNYIDIKLYIEILKQKIYYRIMEPIK